ncbi:MAG TPA: class I SAM-dependent methyltransferase [Nitrospiria bacterium]
MSNEQVVSFYRQSTKDYDEVIASQPFFINSYALYDKLLVTLLNGRRYRKILDLGCGTGAQTVTLAGYGDEVVGVDIAEDLLALARKRCREFPNVRCVNEDARNLPFEDESYDFVVSYGDVLSHIWDGYEKALSEMVRVAKPGSIVTFEVDNKWNACLMYHPRELLEALCSPGRGHDTRVWEGLRFKTFTHPELVRMTNKYGLELLGYHGHNILASIIPDRFTLKSLNGNMLGRIALGLGKIDMRLSGVFPFNRLGFNSMVVTRKKGRGLK